MAELHKVTIDGVEYDLPGGGNDIKSVTLRFNYNDDTNLESMNQVVFDIIEGDSDMVVDNSKIKLVKGRTYILSASSQSGGSTGWLYIYLYSNSTLLATNGSDGNYQSISINRVYKCEHDEEYLRLRTETNGSARKKSTTLTVFEISDAQNVPGGQHTYNTEEQVVGTWIDGKPVYERSYIFLTNEATEGVNSSTIINAPDNIDNIIQVTCTIKTASTIHMLPIFNLSFNRYVRWKYEINDNTIVIDNNLSSFGLKEATMIVKYTKTTD